LYCPAAAEPAVGFFIRLVTAYAGQGGAERQNKQVTGFRDKQRNRQGHNTTAAMMDIQTTLRLEDAVAKGKQKVPFLKGLRLELVCVRAEAEAAAAAAAAAAAVAAAAAAEQPAAQPAPDPDEEDEEEPYQQAVMDMFRNGINGVNGAGLGGGVDDDAHDEDDIEDAEAARL
jgi:ribosomal protein L12E/L44/L45/RPP1/RPP2